MRDLLGARPMPSDVHLELGGLAEDVNALATRAEALGDRQAAADLRQAADAALDPDTRVVVLGEFNVGKSTLINALLGETVLRSAIRPATAVAVELRGGRTRVWAKRFTDGTERPITKEEFEACEALDADSLAQEGLERLRVTVNQPLLHHLVLIDTPGLLDRRSQDERARREGANADLVVLVISARKAWSDTERDAAERWLAATLGKPVLVVVNGVGLLRAGDGPVLREYMAAATTRLSSAWRPDFIPKVLFEADAMPALRWQLLREGARPGDDFEVLRGVLRKLRGKGGESVSRRSRLHRLGSLLGELRAENEVKIEQWRRSQAIVEARVKQETLARQAAVAALERRLVEFDARVAGEQAIILHEADRFRPGGSRFPNRLLAQRQPDQRYRDRLEEVLRERASIAEQVAAECVIRLAELAGAATAAVGIAAVEISLPPDRPSPESRPPATIAGLVRMVTGGTAEHERLDEAHRNELGKCCRQIADSQDRASVRSFTRVVAGLRSELEARLAAARQHPVVTALPDMPHEIAARIALTDDLTSMIVRTRQTGDGPEDNPAGSSAAKIELA